MPEETLILITDFYLPGQVDISGGGAYNATNRISNAVSGRSKRPSLPERKGSPAVSPFSERSR